jgi:dihydroorotate dehydrogenase (fumarate)
MIKAAYTVVNMHSQLQSAVGLSYQKAIKPLLFTQPPDKVHANIVRLGRNFQKSRALSSLLHKSLAYKHESLQQQLAGVEFQNPVGLSAGFDKNFELIPLMRTLGFGFMEGGSLTYYPCAGNPRPWFHRLPRTKSIVVHAGLGNDGVEPILKRIGQLNPEIFDNFPLDISIAKTNSPTTSTDKEAVADYEGSAKRVKESGCGQMMTVNISCPNTYGGEPFTTPGRLGHLLDKIDTTQQTVPVFIKMPIDLPWSKFKQLVKIAANHNIQGLTIGNLAKDRSKMALLDPLPSTVKGGVSGAPTWTLSNNLIRKTFQNFGDRFVIIGVGGISSAEHAYTKIRLGASLVQIISGLIYEGPQLPGQINRGLVRLLQADGYSHISEAIGVDS